MRVRTLPGAERDLLRIYDRIAIDNPPAARAMVRRVRERILGLADFPEQGRPAEGGRRELAIAGTPYLALYRIVGDEVRIGRILHGRQDRQT